MWRIRPDQKLRELYKELDIVVDVKKGETGTDWALVRMDQGRTVKKILESKPKRSRR